MIIKPFIMPVLLAGTVLFGGMYIKAKLTDIVTLKYNNEQLKISIVEQQEVLKQKNVEFAQVRASVVRTEEINVALGKEFDALRDKFNKIKPDGTKRDIGKLATAKDKLIERVINKGTSNVFDCFERVTSNEIINVNTCSSP
jgi:hypothetical protein